MSRGYCDVATYVTSDLHLNHFSIIDFERWNLDRNGLSYIDTLQQYNEMVVRNVNLTVNPSDTLYILGDFAFGGSDVIRHFLSQINGYKILIKGNHDRYSVESALRMGFDEAYDHPIYLPGTKGKILLSHYPAREALDNPYIVYNLHGHIHGGYLDLPNFRNVNIAMNGYHPINMETFTRSLDSMGRNRNEPWLGEWFAKYQVFKSGNPDIVVDQSGKIDLEATISLTKSKNRLT